MSIALHSTIPMHTHRCEACAKQGKEIIWIHPEQDFGQVAAHKCPQCGTINWKQCKVENGKLPAPQPRNGVNFETLLGYIVLAVGLAILGYCAFLYVKKVRAGHSPNILNEGCE